MYFNDPYTEEEVDDEEEDNFKNTKGDYDEESHYFKYILNYLQNKID